MHQKFALLCYNAVSLRHLSEMCTWARKVLLPINGKDYFLKYNYLYENKNCYTDELYIIDEKWIIVNKTENKCAYHKSGVMGTI